MSSAVDTHNVTTQRALNLNENDLFVSQLGPFRSAVRWAFNSKEKDISEPLETESFYAVFMLDSIISKGVKPFENAKDEIYRDLLKENEFAATNLYAEEVKSAIMSGASFKSIKDENNRVELVPSDRKKLNGSFISLGKSEQLVGALIYSEKGKIIGPVKTTRGHGIVKVENITSFDSSNWEVSKDMIRNELMGRKERETYGNWIKNLKDEADIIDNRKYHF